MRVITFKPGKQGGTPINGGIASQARKVAKLAVRSQRTIVEQKMFATHAHTEFDTFVAGRRLESQRFLRIANSLRLNRLKNAVDAQTVW